jgi:hypothetical protein
MEAAPFQTLANTVISTGITFKLLFDSKYFPILFRKADSQVVLADITIFADTAARASAGKFLKVPLLGGSNLNEGDIFVVGDELLTLGVAPIGITQTRSALLTEVRKNELGNFVLEFDDCILFKVVFTCTASTTALQRINAGVTTFRYQYQGICHCHMRTAHPFY